MYKNIVILYMLGHVLGEFYFHFQEIEESKTQGYKSVIKHSWIYFLWIFAVSIPIVSIDIMVCNVMIALSHMLVDSFKVVYIKKYSYKEKYVFLIEQLVHIFTIMIIVYFAIELGLRIVVLDVIDNYFVVSEISKIRLIRWTLLLLVLHKPANIFVQKMIGDYKPAEHQEQFRIDNNVGRYIGTIERWIMILLLSVNQYAAMGFVLTAKSIARYDRISKEKEFAEYYLLGTLMSTMIVIASGVCLL